MIYEQRRYDCLPGKIAALHELMETLAIPVFERLGMKVVGCWTPAVGDDENCLIYLLAYEDMGARQRAWDKFWVDPQWLEGRAKMAAKFGGPIVARSNSVFLKPAAYSPLK
jgi:NIPSNAP protein